MIKIKKISDLKYEIENNPFYTDGKGGQLGDRGFIKDAKVNEVGENFVILDKNLDDGEYEFKIDEFRQKDIAKQHTAQHIFSALAYNLYNLNTVGFKMSEEYTTVDLDSKDITNEMIQTLEIEVNKIIEDSIKLEEIIYSNEDARKLENLRKQVKDKIKGDVRFIKISNIDICACAGFHVDRTSEIKIFKIINHETIKGHWTRFYFLAGDRAINDYKAKHEITKTLTNIFSCKNSEILEMLDKNLKEKEKIEQNYKNILYKFVELSKDNFEKNYFEHNGIKIIIYNENKDIANILFKYINLDKFLLISGFDLNYTLMTNTCDCQRLVKNLTATFPNIKGGGSQKKANIKLDKIYTKENLLEIIKNCLSE